MPKKVTEYLKLECWQDYTKTTGWISTKLVRRMGNGRVMEEPMKSLVRNWIKDPRLLTRTIGKRSATAC